MQLQINSVATEIIAAQADLVDAQKALDDVLKSSRSQANAKQELADAQKALDDAQKEYDRLNRPRVSDELIEQTADELETAQERLRFMTWVYNKFFHYDKMADGRIAKSELTLKLLKLEENVDNLVAKYNWYTSKPDEISIYRAKAALDLAQARAQDAQREADRLKNIPNPDDVTIAKARADAAQSKVNSLYIIAPFDGEVLAIEQSAGHTVSAGTVALRLANRSRLHVDAQVVESDIALVKIGDPATITLDSIPDQTFTGRVTLIEQVGKPVAGLIKYTVHIELDPINEFVLIGGTADVAILFDEARTPLP